VLSTKIRSLDNVVSTETFMYLQLRKQTYSWGVR
jgi:Lrp/AsnC family transcriptional regulator, regulator for asnA, asnC and gidA